MSPGRARELINCLGSLVQQIRDAKFGRDMHGTRGDPAPPQSKYQLNSRLIDRRFFFRHKLLLAIAVSLKRLAAGVSLAAQLTIVRPQDVELPHAGCMTACGSRCHFVPLLAV